MTGEELAALVVALAAMAPEQEAGEDRMPAWRRTMREEAVESGV